MKNNAKRLLTGITAAVMSLSAVGTADVAALGSAVSAFAADGVAVNAATFPDENFRKYVSANFDTDSNGVLSDSEIEAATFVDISRNNISSLKGIEYLTALEDLSCSGNQLTSLDMNSNVNLMSLYCNDNQLASLDISKNTKLWYLDCGNNRLPSLDVSNNTSLVQLLCNANQLTDLDVSNNAALLLLYCGGNMIKNLDVSRNYALTSLTCSGNRLKSLDVSNNTALTTLGCQYNALTSLDISRNTALTELYCQNNELTSLDLSSNTILASLSCADNQYTLKTASLSELTERGFDGTKAGNWQGATYDDAANSLTNITSDIVTYSYDLGNGQSETFTLKTSKIPTPVPTPDPAKPVVTAEPTYGGAEVTWKPVDGAINYRVFTCVPGQKIRQFGSDTKGTSMTVKGLNGGQKTGIIVLAQFANKKWSTYTEDDIVYVTPLDAVKPYLCVNPKADGNVYLIWSSVPTSVRYKVMAREVGTKNWELIGATRQRCRITVDGFDPNKQYEFLVRGLNAKGKYTPMAADDIVVGTSLS